MARTERLFWTGGWCVIACMVVCCVEARADGAKSDNATGNLMVSRDAEYYRSHSKRHIGSGHPDVKMGYAHNSYGMNPSAPRHETRHAYGSPHQYRMTYMYETPNYDPLRLWRHSSRGPVYDYGRPYRTWRSDDYRRQRLIEQDQQRDRQWQERVSRLRQSHVRLVNQGLDAFRAGEYRKAATSFVAATEADQGDPGSRLHAAHALFAIGEYRLATTMVRRAFELQPQLIALLFDIRDDYGTLTDFETHLAALTTEAQRVERDEGLWVLLSYVRAYSGDSPGAYRAAKQAQRLNPRDAMARVLAVAHRTAALAREDLTARRARTATPSPRTETATPTRAAGEPMDNAPR